MCRLLLFLLGLGLLLSGCSSNLQVTEISDLKAGDRVSGVPFRVPERYTVHLYVWDEKSKKYVHVQKKSATIANPDRLYAANFDSDFFSDHSLEVRMNPNGTLQFVNLTSDSKADELLKQLGASVKSNVEAFTSIEASKDAAEAAKVSDQNEKELALRTAENEVSAAQAALDSLPVGASLTDRTKAENDLSLAKTKANNATRNLGRSPIPYPEAVP